jgi:hypothetical protein
VFSRENWFSCTSNISLLYIYSLVIPLGMMAYTVLNYFIASFVNLGRVFRPRLCEFDMSFTMIRSIAALAESPLLTNLHMQSSHVADISGLLECLRLEAIDMADCLCLREANVLMRLPALQSVDFSNCKLADDNVLIGRLTQAGVKVTVI